MFSNNKESLSDKIKNDDDKFDKEMNEYDKEISDLKDSILGEKRDK